MATPVKDIQERKYFCTSLEYDGVVEQITKVEEEKRRAILFNRGRYDREMKRIKHEIDVEEKKIEKRFDDQVAILRRNLKQLGERKDRLRKAIHSSGKYCSTSTVADQQDAQLVSKQLFCTPEKCSPSKVSTTGGIGARSPVPSTSTSENFHPSTVSSPGGVTGAVPVYGTSSAFSPVQPNGISSAFTPSHANLSPCGKSSGCTIVPAGQGSASAKQTASWEEMSQALQHDADDDITFDETLKLLDEQNAMKERNEECNNSCGDGDTGNGSDGRNENGPHDDDDNAEMLSETTACSTDENIARESCSVLSGSTELREGAVCSADRLFTSAVGGAGSTTKGTKVKRISQKEKVRKLTTCEANKRGTAQRRSSRSSVGKNTK